MQYFKIKTIHRFLVISLTLVFTVGALGIGIFANQIEYSGSTNVLGKEYKKQNKIKNTQNKKKKQRQARISIDHLITQAAEERGSARLSAEEICQYDIPKKAIYQGEFIQQETKIWTAPGSKFEVALYLKNTGNIPWFSNVSGCSGINLIRLGTARDHDRGSIFYNPNDPRWITANRIHLQEERVNPGEIGTFRFSGFAPKVNDIFREYFQPVVENISWMQRKDETAHIDIYVGENDQENERRLFYLGKSGQASPLDISGEPIIDIDISEQKLLLKLGNTIVREYTVSTGTFKTPTPLGRFKILNKQELRIANKWPHYHMPKWQGFTIWGHGLHGLPYLANDRGIFWNEALNHIGQRVSHGCVRLLPEDAEDLYNLTTEGITLVIHE